MNLGNFINQNYSKTDVGLLLLRLGFGFYILLAGVQKLMGGTAMFEQLGGAMAMFGITFAPVFWGLLSSLVETFGGVCILLGLFFRPATLLLFLNMIVATMVVAQGAGGLHFSSLDDLIKFVNAISVPKLYGIVFLALLLSGPGKYALQKGGRSGGGSKSSARE